MNKWHCTNPAGEFFRPVNNFSIVVHDFQTPTFTGVLRRVIFNYTFWDNTSNAHHFNMQTSCNLQFKNVKTLHIFKHHLLHTPLYVHRNQQQDIQPSPSFSHLSISVLTAFTFLSRHRLCLSLVPLFREVTVAIMSRTAS